MLLSLERPTYLHGVNLAWLNYGGDFGRGDISGNLANKDSLTNWFSIIHGAGMNTVRWFMFPGDPWQIRRGPTNLPTSIDPRVWPDLDLALELAEKYDQYLNLVIFDHPESLPDEWRNTETGRQRLMSALSGMFRRYRNHPRILAWELGNEWDNRIIPPERVDPFGLTATVRAFTTKAHDTTRTLATTSNGGATTLGYFTGLGLDFYSVHWYDHQSSVRLDDYNVGLHDAAYYATRYGVDKPLVVGEFCATDAWMTADAKYAHFAQSGYAGGWGWSATPAANDGLRIDWESAAHFNYMIERPAPA